MAIDLVCPDCSARRVGRPRSSPGVPR